MMFINWQSTIELRNTYQLDDIVVRSIRERYAMNKLHCLQEREKERAREEERERKRVGEI